MNITPIEWTDFSANPLKYQDANGKIVWGCVHASPGCQLCYSESLAKRYGRGGPFNVNTMAGLTPFMDDKELRSMLTHKPAAGKRCFVGDMTDIFGEWVPSELLDKLFAVSALRQDVTWQILTKRAARMLEYIGFRQSNRLGYIHAAAKCHSDAYARSWPLPNVWLGVSVENQEYADKRIPLLLQTPAAVRFVSYEPALGLVDFLYPKTLWPNGAPMCCDGRECGCRGEPTDPPLLMSGPHFEKLDWIIVGGESGNGARPFNINWARNALRQCKCSSVACFIKQLGSNVASDDEHWPQAFVHGKNGLRAALYSRKGGNMAEWPEDLRVREFPKGATA